MTKPIPPTHRATLARLRAAGLLLLTGGDQERLTDFLTGHRVPRSATRALPARRGLRAGRHQRRRGRPR
ncbi:MAG: hypothetical protein WKG07_21060 [Hymenobacter sp.]